MTTSVNAEIGERVHGEMWRSRITQKQLSEALGIDQAAVSRRLRGRTEWKVSELLLAARLLGISPIALIPLQSGEVLAPPTTTSQDAVADSRCGLRLVRLAG